MEQNLFEEIKEVNQFNYKTVGKQLVSAPLNAEQYCDLSDSETEEEPEIEDTSFEHVYFADFESFTKNEADSDIQHDPFLICHCRYSIKEDKTSKVKHGRNIFSLLNDIVKYKSDHHKFLVYFHNLSYDAAFILKEYVDISSFLMIDGSII